MSSDTDLSEIWLAEAVANSVHINSLVLVDSNGIQLSQLMAACLHGNIDYVEALLEVPGVKVDLQNDTGRHALQLACMRGYIEIARLILSTSQCTKYLVNIADKWGSTSLITASQYGQTETVSLLIQNGAHVNMQNNNGSCSLIVASVNGHSETVSLLIQNGAHVNLTDKWGSTSLIIASQYGQTETVSLLIQNGAHVNMQNNDGSCSLIVASVNGHSETVSLLIQNGAHVNMQNDNGESSLMLTNSVECSRQLTAYGADIFYVTKRSKQTALEMAIIRGNTDIALHLIDCGAHININGPFATLYASHYNRISIMNRILASKKSLLDDSIDGYTPLMFASLSGHVEMVQLLLEAGVRVNFTNFSDYQSLHLPIQQQMQILEKAIVSGSALDMAVIIGHVEVVPLLLQYGAKVHNIYYLLRSITLKQAQANAKITETHWGKYQIILQILFSHDSDLIGRVQYTNPSTLYMACAFGVLEMVSLLIELGVNVSDLYRTDASGLSYWCSLVTIISSGSLLSATASKQINSDINLLHKVNWEEYSRLISILTENGLDVNHKDSSGSFALNIASREGHTDLVSLLLKYSADVNLQDEEGLSSLMEAVSCGHLDICIHLLRSCAKVNLQDRKGWSPLMFAVTAGDIDFVLLLLERYAEINLQDASGTSSLMLSCFAGDTHVTKVLLERGANINLQNEDGITALMMSSYNGHTEIVELLLGYGADLYVMTSIGMTALRVSADNGHKEVTKLLIEQGANRHVTSSLPACRKRTAFERDSTAISTRVVTQDSSSQEARLEKIEKILQSLLDNSTASNIPAYVSEKHIKLSEKPTLSKAFRALHLLAYDWQNIGILLNLENNSLKEIDINYRGKPKDCLREMLNLWLVRAIPPPTWEELAEAVEPTDQTIAHKIRKTN